MDDAPLCHSGVDGWTRRGVVTGATASEIRVEIAGLAPGAAVRIDCGADRTVLAEAIAVDGRTATCCALGETAGVLAGARASSSGARISSYVGASRLGRAVDAWGRCDGAGGGDVARRASSAPADVARPPIRRRLRTGVAGIDAFAALGYGQRIALIAGAGVGKTTLVRRIVNAAAVDARVITLVGERAREAAETVDALRRAEIFAATTVVCATADRPAVERLAAVRTAAAHAEALADEGRDVLLVVDSLTRAATAWREMASAAGEPLAHRGHPASLASMLAGVVERAGTRPRGTVTGVYAVLVEGDDPREPVTDAVRALVDGHIVLARALVDAGRFPAIDVLRSLSRLMPAVASPSHVRDAGDIRRALAVLERADDLLALGAYEPGADPWLDAALTVRDDIERLIFDGAGAESARDVEPELARIAGALRDRLTAARPAG